MAIGLSETWNADHHIGWQLREMNGAPFLPIGSCPWTYFC